MYKNLTRISTKDMSHEVWLEERKKAIGGSDASSIIGLNPWSSPYTVWADKLGKIPPKEDNEAMRLGRDLEDYVAQRFCEKTGKKVRRERSILYNKDYPFAHANVDRLIVGEDAGLECKTTSVLNLSRFKNGSFPDNYYVQCVHYLMVTGCKKWYLGVLVLGEGFYDFTIERDEEEIAALAKSEAEFWEYVRTKTPPMVDGKESTSKTVSLLYPDSKDETVGLTAYNRELAEYTALSAQIKALEERKDEVANKVKAFMKEAGKGESDRYRVSWATAERNNFDAERFAADHSDIDLSEYYKNIKYRTFKVTEIGA